MKTIIGIVYKNSNGDYFTPAQTGNFYIVDMWPCSKDGEVKDINENPCPIPVNTSDLKKVRKSKFNYDYPEFSVNF